MTETHACPDRGRLEQLMAGHLSAVDQEALSRHVESCPDCQRTLDELARSSWDDKARHMKAETPPGPALQHVMHQALRQETEAEVASGNAKPADDLAFLLPSSDPKHLGRLGHYEVLDVVGRGGMGIVLKAFDERLHRVVAIKALLPEFAASATARQRFVREARAVAAISHDHVVTIHAVEESHRPPYFVMQYVEGVSLEQKLEARGALGVKEILRIGMQAASGLAAAHKHGLIHRDVKPANILLENGVERVKLTDFGLARTVDDASITQSGVIAGTPMYMAPEQAAGEAVDHRADLFSLGSVLYAMCTGRPPFRATGSMAVLRRVIDDTPTPIRDVNPEIPDWLCRIIAKLHAKKPDERFQSAKDVAELLEQHLADLQQPGRISVPAPSLAAPGVPAPPTVPARASAKPRAAPRLTTGHYWILVPLILAALGSGVFLVLNLLPGERSNLNPGGDPSRNDNLTVIVDDLGLRVRIRPEAGGNLGVVNDSPAKGFQLPPGRYHVQVVTSNGDGLVHQEWVDLKANDKKTIRVESGWVQLFNGQDLEGWKTHPEQPGGWRVDTGLLIGSGQRAHLFSDRDNIGNVHFRVEAKISDGGNGGQCIRCPFILRPGSATPLGYEAEINSTDKGQIAKTGSLWADDVKPEVLVKDMLVPPDTWFVQEVIAQDNHIVVKVNGKVTADYVDRKHTYIRGHVALQNLLPASKISFRKVEIKEVPGILAEAKPRVLKAFTPQDKVTQSPFFPQKGKISMEEDGWKIVAYERGVAPLFAVAVKDVQKGTLTLRAKMKSANLPDNAYLRLDVFLGNEVVVCPVSRPLQGVTDWTALESSYAVDENHIPDSARVNVAFDSRGTAWIKDVEVVYVPPAGVVAADPKPAPQAVLDELRGLVSLKKEALRVVEVRFKEGMVNALEVCDAAIDWIEARIKLAAAERKSIVPPLEDLLREREKALSFTKEQFKAGAIPETAVLAARQRVAETRVRLQTARAEAP
jgi:serine/threonine protein kinase